MKVKLISYTQPSIGFKDQYPDISTIEEMIAFVARVSNPSNQNNTKTSEKLVKYLMANKHWSPLEMIDVTLEIETTRDIARQILRHRSFVFQEFSQRYADPNGAFEEIFEYSIARLQDTKNRQNSVDLNAENLTIDEEWQELQKSVANVSLNAYNTALKMGIAKEVARKVLPEGLTKSRLYMKGSIRSWIHYLETRGPGTGTQREHIQIAEQIGIVLNSIFNLNKKG